ncbi:MAG: hypothetical protein WB949_08715 [Candidatus Acidiferrales bacterium]
MTYNTSTSAFSTTASNVEQTPRPPNPTTRLISPADEPGPSVTLAELPPACPPESASPEIEDILSQIPAGTRLRFEPPLPSRAMHVARCKICRFDVENAIDEAFVNWECVYKIAREFEISARSIYRHAHATGLFAKRDRNIRRALGHLLHEADRVVPTADSVVSAAKVFAHINSRGEWVNPPARVIYSAAPRQSRKLTRQRKGPARRGQRRKTKPSRAVGPRSRKLPVTRGRVKKGIKP